MLIEAPRPDPAPIGRIARAAGSAVLVLVVDAAVPSETTAALREGADACFVRPVHFMELEARLTALGAACAAAVSPGALGRRPGPRSGRPHRRGSAIAAQASPCANMRCSTACWRRGEAVGAGEILQQVWGGDADFGPDRVRTAVARLRVKLAAALGRPLIETVRGHGYRLTPR